jgi:hypothetical protein
VDAAGINKQTTVPQNIPAQLHVSGQGCKLQIAVEQP